MPTYTKLTPALAARIVLRVARGVPIETVQQQLGLGNATVWQWQQEGLQAAEPRPLARRLAKSIARARAHREWHVLQRIERVADTPEERSSDRLKADFWLLERHPAYRDRYGIKVEVNHTGQHDPRLKQLEGSPDAEVLELLPDEWKALLPPGNAREGGGGPKGGGPEE